MDAPLRPIHARLRFYAPLAITFRRCHTHRTGIPDNRNQSPFSTVFPPAYVGFKGNMICPPVGTSAEMSRGFRLDTVWLVYCFLANYQRGGRQSIPTDSKHRHLAVPHDVLGNAAQE
jgi:hypothetical protein